MARRGMRNAQTTLGTTRATIAAAGTEFTRDGRRVSPVPATVQQACRA